MEQQQFDLQHFRDFDHLEFYARQVVEGFITGLHKSPFHGFSVEFSEHRIYNPGESTRNIDWKLYGRTDRLYVKRYEEETNLRCRIVLDTSGSMYYPYQHQADLERPNKLLFSTVSILALMNLFRRQRDAVGLSLFGQSDYHSEARSTRPHLRLINLELYKLLNRRAEQLQAEAIPIHQQLHLIAQKINKRSLVIVFSDLLDLQDNQEAFFDALKHLKFQKHEIIIFWTTDQRTELAFELEDRPLRFVDLESGEKFKADPRQIRERYREAVQDFASEIERRALQYRVDFVQADVGKGYHQVLQNYLIKRRKLL